MSEAREELRRLARLLRAELEWASRTGIEVVLRAESLGVDGIEEEHLPPALPVEAGRPAPPEPAEETKAPREEDPPPAFEPDPEDLESAPPPFVPPSKARRREGPTVRPWERYLDEAPGGSDPRSPTDGPPSLPPRRTPSPSQPWDVRSALGADSAPSASRMDSAPSASPAVSGSPKDPSSVARTDALRLSAAQNLGEIRQVLGDCTRCKLHRAGRKQIVFGVGNPNADLMFVGEAPGQQEDFRGEPFVGDAGQLLTRIIEQGMGVRRSDVYIANIVKCRPPRNRDPEPDEVEACEPFLRAQIRQIRPTVLVALGRYAAQTLLRTGTPISRLRGRWQTYEGIDLMPTFHPAYLLRNPAEKRPVWMDIQAVMQRLGWTSSAR